MKNGLVTTLAFLGALAGAGRASANPSVADLKALEDHARANGTTYDYSENGVDMGKLYRVQNADKTYTINAYRDFMTLIDESGKTFIFYDFGKDGTAEAAIVAPGRMKPMEVELLEGQTRFGMTPSEAELEAALAGMYKGMDKHSEAYNNRMDTYINSDSVSSVDYKGEKSSTYTGENASKIKNSINSIYEMLVNKFKRIFGVQ